MKRSPGTGRWALAKEEVWQSFMRRRAIVPVDDRCNWFAERMRAARPVLSPSFLASARRPAPVDSMKVPA